jgi:hypothetical protein
MAEYVRGAIMCFGVGALGLTIAWRTATAGLRIDSNAIVVRGPLKTRRVPLPEAAGFTPGLTTGLFSAGTPCPVLKTANAGWVYVWALGLFAPSFITGYYEGAGVVRTADPQVVQRWRGDQVSMPREPKQRLQPLCDKLNELLASLGFSVVRPT